MLMPRAPKYCHHRAKDLAYVTINGTQVYLGKYDSPESRDRYDEEILRWRKRNGTAVKHSTTVGQLCLAFLAYADERYRDKDGNPTGTANNYRKSLRPLVAASRRRSWVNDANSIARSSVSWRPSLLGR
jgi:hypothetical protein